MMSKPDLATLRIMLADKAAGNRSLVVSGKDEFQTENELATPDDPRSAAKGPSLRAKALQYLARREHARAELRQKLLPLTENPEEVDILLDDFATRGWLSDTRFAEQWTHQRGSRYGAQRLRQELRQKGVDSETIAHALEDIADTEEARARLVWQKRFGTPPADMKEKAKQLRFLAARGFSLDVIYKIVGGNEDCDL